MRVLLLRRGGHGGIATLTNALPESLDKIGVEAVVDDAEQWIPKETGWKVDRAVNKLVLKAAAGFDLVHAFGYRCTWACSEAFYVRKPWLYTAYDFPKSMHPDVLDRLLASKAGVCTSWALRNAFKEKDIPRLSVVMPGIAPRENAPSSKENWGVPEDAPLVVGLGRFVEERGFDALVSAMPAIWEMAPNAHLIISGAGPEEERLKSMAEPLMPKARVVKWLDKPGELLAAADVVVVPSRRAAFSMLGAEAMMMGKPVVFRDTGGLAEMADEGMTGFFFSGDEGIAGRVGPLLEAADVREMVGKSAREKAEGWFGLDRCAEELADVYRKCLARD